MQKVKRFFYTAAIGFNTFSPECFLKSFLLRRLPFPVAVPTLTGWGGLGFVLFADLSWLQRASLSEAKLHSHTQHTAAGLVMIHDI